MSFTPGVDIDWSREIETQLCDTAEHCECQSFIHRKSEEFFTARAVRLDLPVIVLSTLAGVSSVGSSSLFPSNEQTASVVIGGVSILVAVMNTINSQFAFSRRAEAHKLAFLQFSKLQRDLKIQMSLPRTQRTNPRELLRATKDEISRLLENSPLIPEHIQVDFKRRFKDQRESISFPEILNGLVSVKAQQKEQRHLRNIVERRASDIVKLGKGGVAESGVPRMEGAVVPRAPESEDVNRVDMEEV